MAFKKLIDAYLDIPYVETLCEYACSDQYVGLSKAPRRACDLLTDQCLVDQSWLPFVLCYRYELSIECLKSYG